MVSRRNFFTGAAAMVGAGLVSRVGAATQVPPAPSNGRPFNPVVTLNGWSLPWRMNNGMDGVTGLTQPPIPAGKTFVYEFIAKRPGTFMYHPHADEMTQMAMGMMGFWVTHPKKAARTIVVDMNDMMRFGPSDITVKQGETIKFVVHNNGKIMHEMVIGTMAELKKHGELMKKHPGMEHDEPYMTHVSPGKKQEMVWQFTQAGEFHYACLLPGHFEAGMVGRIKVVKG